MLEANQKFTPDWFFQVPVVGSTFEEQQNGTDRVSLSLLDSVIKAVRLVKSCRGLQLVNSSIASICTENFFIGSGPQEHLKMILAQSKASERYPYRVVQLFVVRVHDVVDDSRLQIDENRARNVVLVVGLKSRKKF